MVARASPWPFQIDCANNLSLSVPMLDLEGRAPAGPRFRRRRSSALQVCGGHRENFLGKVADEFLDKIRHLLKIGIRPVGLQHGEFRIVLSRNALVAEVATDLENFVEPAYEQAF